MRNRERRFRTAEGPRKETERPFRLGARVGEEGRRNTTTEGGVGQTSRPETASLVPLIQESLPSRTVTPSLPTVGEGKDFRCGVKTEAMNLSPPWRNIRDGNEIKR